MFGILLCSHGQMAKGMLDSCKLFFGDDIEKVKAVCLSAGENMEEFDEEIENALVELDADGHGVVAMCDLMGGTPCNQMAFNFINDRVQVISGMNFTILLELLGKRCGVEDIDEVDFDELIETGKNGIIHLNKMVRK